MKKKMSDTKKALIVLLIIILVCAISFVGTNYFGNKAKNHTYDYETIKCIVTDGYVKYGKYSETKIYVEYKGKEYTLQQPGASYNYLINKEIEAYLYNGKIYADYDDIQHDSKDGKIAGVFIIIRFISGILFVVWPIISVIGYIQKKKLDKQKSNSGFEN